MRRPQNGRSCRKYLFLAIGIFGWSLASERMHGDSLGVTLLVVAVTSVAVTQVLDRKALEQLREERS